MTQSYKEGEKHHCIRTASARRRRRTETPHDARAQATPSPPCSSSLKRDKVLAYKQMFLMYPMHKDEEVT